ncbi:MAG TPA: ABC transporter ATP-binding protein [Candidatus Limivivens intestinipullorum]|uniref:ABC transporter ATP-binding protein n=1 Tax=Candidatus Limivivens intestinipullorum TaxID=2840858 RepID=A0A9D1ETB1_9FIRM|nr:ABC transporter ATP-binding protein [Candidatus Limivivens intestinipullorum]
MDRQIVLQMNHIMKIYGNGVVANEDVSLELRKGEIHALLGENGAGKSTLMKVLFGIEAPDQGEIVLNGKATVIKSPQDAISKGIGMVHQHFMLVPSLTVAENIILGVAPKKGLFIDMDKAIEAAANIAKEYNFEVDVRQRVEEIPVGIKQKVEILKALYRGAQILILDEPTAVLTPQETDELFVQLMKLREKGHTIIFISHKLDEIKKICDRATIMRNGRSMGTYEVADISTQEMSKLMVGREISLQFDKKPQHLTSKTLLKVRNLTVYNTQGVLKVDNLSFDIKGGEILGIAGVEGNGQTELIDTLTGLNKKYKGQIQIKGKEIAGSSIADIRGMKVAHIPEDRMTTGCASTLSIQENLFSYQFRDPAYSGKVLLKQKEIEKRSDSLIKEFLVKCKSRKQNVGMLSGGNIQKVIVAREFSTAPDIIIANQPTRGIDVGAAAFIRQRLLDFRDAGCAVILVSADLTEVFSLSDRLAVMYKGKFAGFFTDVGSVTEEELGQHMLGIKQDERLEGVLYE